MLWKGRGQSSCRHLQLSGSLEWPKAENTNDWHGAQEISTFHQREDGSWMASDKSHYWIISDFQELVAMVQADCNAFTIYSSFPTLYFQQKVRLWKEDNVFFRLNLHSKDGQRRLNLRLQRGRIPFWSWGDLFYLACKCWANIRIELTYELWLGCDLWPYPSVINALASLCFGFSPLCWMFIL